jgi:hypothetical protein
MISASVAQACDFFKSQNPTEISREAVMAYATLRAIEHYYPEMLEESMKGMLEKFSWIKTEEPARAIKQKRIMSWVISRELESLERLQK